MVQTVTSGRDTRRGAAANAAPDPIRCTRADEPAQAWDVRRPNAVSPDLRRPTRRNHGTSVTATWQEMKR
jgi:hypothetical protein